MMPIKRAAVLALAVLAAGSSWTAIAQSAGEVKAGAASVAPTAEQLAELSDDELGRRVDGIRNALMTPARWCELAAYAREVARRRPGRLVEAAAELTAGQCADAERRYAPAIAHWTRGEELYGTDASPDLRMEIDAQILLAAARSNDKAAFALHLQHVADRGWPEEYAKADVDLWRYGVQLIGARQAGPIAITMVRSAAFPYLPEDAQALIAPLAIRPALAAGDMDLAYRMAMLVPDPALVRDMLINREFAVLWPRLEEAAGPRLAVLREGAVRHARARYQADPDDLERRAALADALLWNGNHAEVLALAGTIDSAPGAAENYDEQDAWLLNTAVKSLDALGRRAEADEMADRIGLLSPDDDRGWVVSFAINRAYRLVDQGRWREALPAAELAMKVAADNGNDYARQIAATARFCAAFKLDPAAPDLPDAWQEITRRAKDSIGSSVMAALCKGDTAAARRFLVAGLEDPATRTRALELLQPPGFVLAPPSQSAVTDPHTLLAGDPKLRALFLKYGRPLPDSLLPN